MDDRLRQAGRPRAVQHPQRVVERQLLERQLGALAQEPVLPARAVEVAERDHVLERRDLVRDLAHHPAAIEVLSAVPVAVDRQQHRRLDLREPVDHAARPELGRGRGPGGADRRAREERGDGLGDVREVRGHPVAGTHPQLSQPAGDRRRVGAQLAPRPLLKLAQLRGVPNRDVVVGRVAEDVLGVAEPRAGVPLGARHRAAPEHPGSQRVEADAEELDQRGPEALDVVDRPPPQLGVVAEAEPVRLLEPAAVARQRRPVDLRVGRRPQELGACHSRKYR